MYKELLHINKRTDSPVETQAKVTNRHLTEKEIQMRNKYTTVYSTLLMTEGIQSKTTRRCQFIPVSLVKT